jgi:spore germination cell wall hydrolase CwlJ-like protein
LIEELKQKVQAKAQRMRRYEKRKNQYIQNKILRETQNNSTDIWERKLQQSTITHIWKKLSFTGSHMGRESATL